MTDVAPAWYPVRTPVPLSPTQKDLFLAWARAAAEGQARMTLGLAREIERATGIPQSSWSEYDVAPVDRRGHNVTVSTAPRPGDARLAHSDHKWVANLHLTPTPRLADWARKHNVSRQRVNSWVSAAKGSGRAIPRQYFNVIRDELRAVGVSITEADFPNGVR